MNCIIAVDVSSALSKIGHLNVSLRRTLYLEMHLFDDVLLASFQDANQMPCIFIATLYLKGNIQKSILKAKVYFTAWRDLVY